MQPKKGSIWHNGGRSFKVGAPEKYGRQEGFAVVDEETGIKVGWYDAESFDNGNVLPGPLVVPPPPPVITYEIVGGELREVAATPKVPPTS